MNQATIGSDNFTVIQPDIDPIGISADSDETVAVHLDIGREYERSVPDDGLRALASAWGSRLHVVGPLGHIGSASKLEHWPDGPRLLDEIEQSQPVRSDNANEGIESADDLWPARSSKLFIAPVSRLILPAVAYNTLIGWTAGSGPGHSALAAMLYRLDPAFPLNRFLSVWMAALNYRVIRWPTLWLGQ